MTQLLLPFSYRADILPGPRFEIPRSAVLRADACVEVPDLGASDIEEVIRLRAGHWRHRRQPPAAPHAIFRRKGGDGRLFAAVLNNGNPVSGVELQAIVREGARIGWDFDCHQYPVPNTRHRSSATNALMRPSFGILVQRERWPLPRLASTNHDVAEGRAIAFLEEAVILVDGAVYAECQEPVWMIRHKEARRYELIVLRQPWPGAAHSCFRLDQRSRALDYAACRGRRVGLFDLAEPVEIVDPECIERDDAFEVGLAAASAWPRLRRCLQAHRKSMTNVFPRELDDLVSNGRRPERWEIPLAMDVIKDLLSRAGRVNASDELYGHLGAIVEGSRRWEYERPGIDPSTYSELSDDDIAALEGVAGF